ncbi:MAG: OadG family protein [Spirochaetaceae bacterium]|jgi:oxaloacetate decarboxylase gamma subunit|nr:OadG family protein [Spirochaetaceae bacterium]
MTIGEMFGQSGVLMLLGMGVVFGFLIILIIVMVIEQKIIHAFGLDKDVEEKPASATVNTRPQGPVVAAISAAVQQYRKTN